MGVSCRGVVLLKKYLQKKLVQTVVEEIRNLSNQCARSNWLRPQAEKPCDRLMNHVTNQLMLSVDYVVSDSAINRIYPQTAGLFLLTSTDETEGEKLQQNISQFQQNTSSYSLDNIPKR